MTNLSCFFYKVLLQLAWISLLNQRSCDFFLTDITNVIDVVSEQKCVAVVADVFVIVLGLQMFTKLFHLGSWWIKPEAFYQFL